MGFNYGLEKKKFDLRWEKLRREYREAGMDEAAIEAMYEYDWQMFNADRAYFTHTQRMPEQCFEDDGDIACDDQSALLVKFFDVFAVLPQESGSGSRYGWTEQIESEKLSKGLRRLSEQDIELLTLYVIEGYSVTEIAAMKGVSHPTISKKLKRIKNFLRNFGFMATD